MKPKWQVEIDKFLNKFIVVGFMSLLTIYTLFLDDVRVLACPVWSDEVFYGISCFAFICFAVEIVLASICKDEYFPGFFFWLDVIATITIIPDIGWIWDPVMASGGSSSTGK